MKENRIRQLALDYRETRYYKKNAKITERRLLKRRRRKLMRALNKRLCRRAKEIIWDVLLENSWTMDEGWNVIISSDFEKVSEVAAQRLSHELTRR